MGGEGDLRMSTSAELVVQEKVRVIPERRTAEYAVPLKRGTKIEARARVNRNAISFEAAGSYAIGDIPKTLEAVDAILALFSSVRQELTIQGVTE